MNLRVLALALAASVVGPAAFAADIPKPAVVKPAPVVVTKSYDWSGAYAGVNGGYGWADSHWVLGVGAQNPGFDAGTAHLTGWLGGVQVGLNVQRDNLLFGVQGDFDFANVTGLLHSPGNPYDNGCWGSLHATADCRTTKEWLANLTARAGLIVGMRSVVYVKGGVAFVGDKFTINNGRWFGSPTGLAYFPVSQTRVGWTAGIGGEVALSDRLSLFAEWDYADFGRHNVNFHVSNPGTVGFLAQDFTAAISQTLQVAKVGLNVRFR